MPEPVRQHEYGALKMWPAAEHAKDREAYTRAKAGLVEELTEAAHTWRPTPDMASE